MQMIMPGMPGMSMGMGGSPMLISQNGQIMALGGGNTQGMPGQGMIPVMQGPNGQLMMMPMVGQQPMMGQSGQSTSTSTSSGQSGQQGIQALQGMQGIQAMQGMMGGMPGGMQGVPGMPMGVMMQGGNGMMMPPGIPPGMMVGSQGQTSNSQSTQNGNNGSGQLAGMNLSQMQGNGGMGFMPQQFTQS